MISEFIRWNLRLSWWFCIFGIPLFALTFPFEAVFDWVSPCDEALIALKAEGVTGLRCMVGSQNSFEEINGTIVHYRKGKDFVFIPSVIIDPTVYEFSEGTGIEKGLKIRHYGALGYLFLYGLLISFSWFVSRPKIVELFMLYHKKPAE